MAPAGFEPALPHADYAGEPERVPEWGSHAQRRRKGKWVDEGWEGAAASVGQAPADEVAQMRQAAANFSAMGSGAWYPFLRWERPVAWHRTHRPGRVGARHGRLLTAPAAA